MTFKEERAKAENWEEARRNYYRNIEEGIPNSKEMEFLMKGYSVKTEMRKKIEERMKNINQWAFACDGKVWRAARRENYHDLFNDYSSEKVLRSSSIDTLTELIQRTGGNLEEIKKLLYV